jgi:uridine phosphorylase
MTKIKESELILNPDGSIYHLQLRPEQLADTVITVGDPDRVQAVSKHFDRILHRAQHREFVTHTGMLGNKHLTVISTGIGTDNIDIVLNELDALKNIDFETRMVKQDITAMDIIRLGTSGTMREDIAIDTLLLSEVGIGMDGLMGFYKESNTIQETNLLESFKQYIKPHFQFIQPYVSFASEELLTQFESLGRRGTTVTATGFYAPQGRQLRAPAEVVDWIDVLQNYKHPHYSITNLEMETAGIYALGKLLGHRCLSINAIIANRARGQFSTNPSALVERMIASTLEIIAG